MKRFDLYFLRIPISLFILCSCIKDTQKAPVDFDEIEYNSGCGNVKYPDWKTSEYVLPYAVGETYTVNLSHCSGSYHSLGKPDQFAIDFAMDIGTAITASRSGTIVHVEESGVDGAFPNNLVIVEHNDGTYLQYMHLTNNGAEVVIGEHVEIGQLLGYSGNTGLAGYPHLHLVATKGSSWQYPYTSFPTTFSNTQKNELSLVQGIAYTALPF